MTVFPQFWKKLNAVTPILSTIKRQKVHPANVNKRAIAIPPDIHRPDYSKKTLLLNRFKSVVEIKSDKQIAQLKEACALAKKILAESKSFVKAGVTSEDINEQIHNEIIKHGAYPSPLHYRGFPKSCCTSINNVVCHGIPDDLKLKEGDIINIDVTVYLNSCHGDTSDTFAVGKIDPDAEKLISATQQCLQIGINACGPGRYFSDIGNVIEPFANTCGFTVCKEFVGHGIGSYFHEPPNVRHTCNSSKLVMQPGMAFTIEPILMEGTNQIQKLYDGWTVVSKDGMRSAQAEHTVLITETGVEVLT